MSIGDKMREIEERAKEGAVDAERHVKNDWAQTKADVEKLRNDMEAEADKRS